MRICVWVQLGAPVFFFSSRRRHTRSLRDWSSDVCSSDLRLWLPSVSTLAVTNPRTGETRLARVDTDGSHYRELYGPYRAAATFDKLTWTRDGQIGRASCRERVWNEGVAGPLNKRTEKHRQ